MTTMMWVGMLLSLVAILPIICGLLIWRDNKKWDKTFKAMDMLEEGVDKLGREILKRYERLLK